MAANKIDRTANTQERCRANWQRIHEGAATYTLLVDGTTIEIGGTGLRVKDLGISTAKIAADAVTFAKMQNLGTDTLIGRDTAGTGDPESISVSGGIVFTGSGGIQTSAFTGDATKTLGGTVLTLATVNSTIGTFNNITINAKGLATAGANVAYLTANQTITLSGDITGSGTTTIATTLATVNANVGTFDSVTVNAKGLVTAASNTMTTKGDLIVFTTTTTRLAVGVTEQMLIADSSATEGVAWRTTYSATTVLIGADNTFTSATKTALAGGNGKTLTAAQITDVVSNSAKSVFQKGEVAGFYSCATAADTLTLTLDVVGGVAGGTTTAVQTHVITMAGTESNVPILIEWEGGWDVAGASGKATGWMRITIGTTATVYLYAPTAIASHTTIDTTGTTNRFVISGQWSTARAGNSMKFPMNHQDLVSRGRAAI